MTSYEAVVVGGGAAGLSAGLVLGRARRRALIVDAGDQCNRPAAGIGGLLGSDLRPPADYYATGAGELERYPTVELREGEIADARAASDGFALTLADGSEVRARRLLLATGMEYRFTAIEGAAERWGRGVFHCPFCHGWEVGGRPLAVHGNGEAGVRKASVLTTWSDDVTLLTDGPADLGPGAAELAARGVVVDERRVERLTGPAGELATVRFADGSQRAVAGLLIGFTLHQRSDLATRLGVAFQAPGPMAAELIEIDAMGRTSVPGVFAAGDVAVRGIGGIAEAVYAGSTAAAAVVLDGAAQVGRGA